MTVIDLEKVNFSYRAGFRISDLTISIRRGSMTGLVGPNGSGKSTVLRLMSGLLVPESGVVSLDRRDLRKYSRRDLASRLAVVSHERAFEFPFKVRDIVRMGRFPHAPKDDAGELAIVEEALEQTGTAHLAARPITQLSSGERQLTLIARALAQQPSVMLLDEPDAHLDVHHQLQVLRLLERLRHDRKITIVLVSHDLSAAASFCGTIGLLWRGHLVKTGPPEEVITPSTIEEVYGKEVTVTRNPVDGMPMVLLTAPSRMGQDSRGPLS